MIVVPTSCAAHFVRKLYFLVYLCGLIAISGCSVRHFAMNKLADTLAHSGNTFSSDDDPDLIRGAAPFSLKLMESILAENSNHVGLLTAAAKGYAQYSFAFVKEDGDELESKDFEAAEALRKRAVRLYLRARKYGMQGLQVSHPNFETALLNDPQKAVLPLHKNEVPLIYWTAAGWGAAISLSKDNPQMLAEVPAMEALMDRALELDETYDRCAIHTFLITYEMIRARGSGDRVARARKHFERAVEISKGLEAAPYVALAEAVAIKIQDVKEFESLLNRALAIDPYRNPEHVLVNMVMQRRAHWLLSRKPDLFLTE